MTTVRTDHEGNILSVTGPDTWMVEHIAFFMREGGQTVPDDYDPHIPQYEVREFMDRLEDEVNEGFEAVHYLDDAEAVDAFLDAAYVAFTGAIRIAGVNKTAEAWEAIIRANESKVDGSIGPKRQDPDTGKILKPEGWTAPDIAGILNA